MKTIISTTTHLSWETIKAYLENKLSRTETHAVEEHLLDCSLCSEAFEGLNQASLTENEKNIIEIWAKIDTTVNNKTKKRFFIYNYRYWAVAASLILALGLVLVLLLTNPNIKTDGNAQIARKNKTEESTETISSENTEKPILEEKTNAFLEKNETAKPVFSKKEKLSEEKTLVENAKPILEEKRAVLADVLEEKTVSEEKTNTVGEKSVETLSLEKTTISEEKNMVDKNLGKEQNTQKTAISEEKSKTDANNIVKTPQNEDTDLALRSQKDAKKKQNSAKIVEKSDIPKTEELVVLDSLSVKKDEAADLIAEKKSVVLPQAIKMLKPNLESLLDSLKVDFAKIEYKTIPQISLLDSLTFATDDKNSIEEEAELVENAKKEQIQENKPKEIAKGETQQEAKPELKAEKTEKIQAKELEISPKDSVETKVQIVLPAEAPVSPEGGWDKFQEYLKANLQYPEDAKRNQVQGMVRIELLIDKEGKIKDLEIKRGLIESCNQEAIRLIKNYKWLAARQNGSAIEERITVRVSFE